MTGRWLAFIESNTTGTGRLFARAAAQQGMRPILMAADPARYPYVAEDAIPVVQLDTQDERALLDACRQLADDSGLAGVCSSSEYFIAAAAAIAGQLGLAGPRHQAIRDCRDKLIQRMRLRSAGVKVPAFCAAESVDEALAAARQLGYPVVVKPTNGSGSVGVRLCASAEAVEAHAAALLAQRRNERGLPVPTRILLEAPVAGPEYSVEVFGGSVVGITAKHLGPLPYFVEVGHDFPAVLTPSDAQAIRDTALRALEALDLGWGPAHVELRLAESGPAIIEVNPRLAGGFIPELVRLASGVDLIAETVRLAAGQPPQLRPTLDRCASIRFILPDRDGALEAVEGVEAAAGMPGVVGVSLYARADRDIRRQGDFRDRLGHVLACGDTPEAARATAERAHRAIRVSIVAKDGA